MDYKQHWNSKYYNADETKLGWYEETSQPSLDIIESCNLPAGSNILIVGAGATTLIDDLVEKGYTGITGTDISQNALEIAKSRLGSKAENVKWIIDDLVNPIHLTNSNKVDFWQDRAVLHFFTEEADRLVYLDLLRKLVKQGGYVLLAGFSKSCAAGKCSGLDVYKYDQQMFQNFLGEDFVEVKSLEMEYTMPSGDKRDYVYSLFRRVNE